MYKLKITELAQNDLDGIVAYTVENLANSIAAGEFLDELEECYSYLKANPYMYAKSADLYLEQRGFRQASVKNYLLFYKISETSGCVTIYRALFGSRDFLKLL